MHSSQVARNWRVRPAFSYKYPLARDVSSETSIPLNVEIAIARMCNMLAYQAKVYQSFQVLDL